jgi:hypothetical protein
VATGSFIAWEIASARVVDCALINDVEMVHRHHLLNGPTLIQFPQLQ